MSSWRAIREVARWEFLRYVKPKQQLIGMLITFVVFGGIMAVNRLGDDDDDERRHVAVIGADVLPIADIPSANIEFSPRQASEEQQLRALVRDEELHALLIVHDVNRSELVLRNRAGWTAEVEVILAAARQRHMLARTGMSEQTLGEILAAPELVYTYPEHSGGDVRAERTAIIIVVSLMLMTVFIGMSYVFASITGEKQIRVTEQVVSAIPAQAWIDGKILGLMAVSLVGVLAQVVAFIAVWVVLGIITGDLDLPLPSSLGNPGIVLLIVLFGALGLGFWFAFLGAIAATIDDPHNSQRGSLLFVPMLATGVAYVTLGDPESAASRFFSLFPATSPSTMPARMMMTDVGAIEIIVSLLLLAASTLLLRIAAGRIFRVAMLMYGKEPSWSELRKWAVARDR